MTLVSFKENNSIRFFLIVGKIGRHAQKEICNQKGNIMKYPDIEERTTDLE